MCASCYAEYGSPTIVSDTTRRVAWRIRRIYDFSSVGGNAHIVVDDWNLSDASIDFCVRQTLVENVHEKNSGQLDAERECLEALRMMALDERASAMAIAEGWILGVEPLEPPEKP